ncbi:DeoR/GlpR family DNA-binding transcription regulator [Staphylococcus pseudintermedius]|uniref:DeoR/GlpR family DNA-binding transcription regulator n=1 Tax=Staphylococcus pseudintermedius TaxID=283734 RepID=UPI0024830765|nr:DeoR/GlpR family DNA-binding transcription regulator [Staphylococcus pseudintermedius]ELH0986427.1 DeoR/GlpR transcriptional regulator [Staphylococcus pseudintermedius]MDI1440757.1 DeoR/GlpR family DNA-binding transcription regulator [Staphylococcus pseudintermedius]MDK3991863.1 DeoR/GlpR family DNA-binding transcription regulator [Staphylococcus pseudintermedius]
MKAKRIVEIEHFINNKNTVTLEELSKNFNVSINTIRRDINQLVKMDKVKKVYGGVESVNISHSSATDFNDRNIEHSEDKRHIGQLAAQKLEAGDVVYIDTGTTTMHILDYIDKSLPLTVITNSLDVMNKAVQLENIDLFIIGEQFKKTTRSFIGVDRHSLLNKMNIQKAFMAATGINVPNGLSNSEVEENYIKQLVMKKSKQKYICVDSSKMNKSTLLTYAPLDSVHSIITNQPLPENISSFAEKNGIEVSY